MKEVVLFDSSKENPDELSVINVNKKTLSIIPNRDLDVLDLLEDMLPYLEESGLTLRKTPLDQLKKDTANYREALMSSSSKKAELSPTIARLKALDNLINTHGAFVKDYLREKFGRELARKYYPSLGFELVNNSRIIPRKQNERLNALEHLISGLSRFELEDKTYGLNFWQKIYDEYKLILSSSKILSGDRTISVQEKNRLKEKLQYKLRLIVKLIEINYEDEADAVLRKWGFQKERYR